MGLHTRLDQRHRRFPPLTGQVDNAGVVPEGLDGMLEQLPDGPTSFRKIVSRE